MHVEENVCVEMSINNELLIEYSSKANKSLSNDYQLSKWQSCNAVKKKQFIARY